MTTQTIQTEIQIQKLISSLEMDELKERQLKRKLLVETLPPEIKELSRGRSKLARFICFCAGWRIRESFSCECEEYRAIRFVIRHYIDISKADLKIHGEKWLFKFARDFGVFDY